MYYGYYLDGDNKIFVCATTPLRGCINLTEEEYYQALEQQELEVLEAAEALDNYGVTS